MDQTSVAFRLISWQHTFKHLYFFQLASRSRYLIARLPSIDSLNDEFSHMTENDPLLASQLVVRICLFLVAAIAIDR
ncbi:hypothetical protein, partial [Undibacterium sp.]|uniref:hypothetical protein n=1 Tax=Undibacterium sp. TaxID=1914977 RepID=UPI002CD1A262